MNPHEYDFGAIPCRSPLHFTPLRLIGPEKGFDNDIGRVGVQIVVQTSHELV